MNCPRFVYYPDSKPFPCFRELDHPPPCSHLEGATDDLTDDLGKKLYQDGAKDGFALAFQTIELSKAEDIALAVIEAQEKEIVFVDGKAEVRDEKTDPKLEGLVS